MAKYSCLLESLAPLPASRRRQKISSLHPQRLARVCHANVKLHRRLRCRPEVLKAELSPVEASEVEFPSQISLHRQPRVVKDKEGLCQIRGKHLPCRLWGATIAHCRRQPTEPPEDTNGASSGPSSVKRKSSKPKKSAKEQIDPSTPVARRTRKSLSKKKDDDTAPRDADEEKLKKEHGSDEPDRPEPEDQSGEENDEAPSGPEEMDEEAFENSFLARYRGSSGISNTLRALSGMMSGTSSRLRVILENLRQKDDSSVQLIALQEFSELLLISTEDNLAGHFSPDHYVKELVALMQPNDFGEENPEIMLLACRCIANLMEALPAATANVVYGGAVPILCQKLLEIHFIDLAEQALSVSFVLNTVIC